MKRHAWGLLRLRPSLTGSAGLLTMTFAMILLIGCAHAPPPAPQQPTGLTADAFWKDQQRRDEETRNLAGKLAMHVEGKRQSLSGRGRLIARLPGNLRIEFRDPIGRLHYVLLLESHRLTAYYPRQKLAYLDDNSGHAYARRFLGIDVPFGDLQSYLLGLLPARYRKFESWQWDAEKAMYRAVAKAAGHALTCFVDPVKATLTEVRFDSARGPIDITFRDFHPCCGAQGTMQLADNVKVALESPVAGSRASLDVTWDELDHPRSPLTASSFQLTLPADVQKVPLN